MRPPEIKWFPGVGELEAWRMDVIVRLITASGLGRLKVGPWARRPFEPDCTFEELAASSGQPLWFQALEELVAETLLDLLHKNITAIPDALNVIFAARRDLEALEPPLNIARPSHNG